FTASFRATPSRLSAPGRSFGNRYVAEDGLSARPPARGAIFRSAGGVAMLVAAANKLGVGSSEGALRGRGLCLLDRAAATADIDCDRGPVRLQVNSTAVPLSSFGRSACPAYDWQCQHLKGIGMRRRDGMPIW